MEKKEKNKQKTLKQGETKEEETKEEETKGQETKQEETKKEETKKGERRIAQDSPRLIPLVVTSSSNLYQLLELAQLSAIALCKPCTCQLKT